MEGKNIQEIFGKVGHDFLSHPALRRTFFAKGFVKVLDTDDLAIDGLYGMKTYPENSAQLLNTVVTFSNSYRGNRKPNISELNNLRVFCKIFMDDLNKVYESFDSELSKVIDNEKYTDKDYVNDILSDPDVIELLKKKNLIK